VGKAGKVYLMAGAGPGTGPKAVRFHRSAVESTGKKKPLIAYVGAAHGDTTAFEKMLGTMIFGLGADLISVKLSKKATKTSAAREQLASADLIFVSGGDVDAGMAVIHDRDLAPYFRELHAQGKVMEGVSAGSIMLGQHWVRFDEEDEAKAEVFDCLGVVPHSFDAHGEKDGWEELQALARLLAGQKAKPEHVYGLVSGHCGVWDGAKLEAAGGALHRYTVAASPARAEDLAEGKSV
jgi:peptidase E